MDKRRNCDRRQNQQFNRGHDHLDFTGEADSRDQHDADDDEPQGTHRRRQQHIVRQIWIDDRQRGRAERYTSCDHENHGRDQERPARKEAEELAKSLRRPFIGGAGIAHLHVEPLVGNRDPQHGNGEQQECPWGDSASAPKQGGCRDGNREPWRAASDPHDDRFEQAETVGSQFC